MTDIQHGNRIKELDYNHKSWCYLFIQCACCQIRIIVGCACAGIAGNVFPATGVSDSDMHHDTCVTPVPWRLPGLLTSGFFWSRWQRKSSGIPGTCATRYFTYLVRGPFDYDDSFPSRTVVINFKLYIKILGQRTNLMWKLTITKYQWYN